MIVPGTYTQSDAERVVCEERAFKRDDGREVNYHVYVAHMKDGTCWRLRGVTSILDCVDKPALRQWAADRACQYVWRAMDFDNEGKCIVTPGWLETVLDKARLAHRDEKEQAADLGTRAHQIIETFLRDSHLPDLAGEPPEVQNAVALFLEWWQAEGLSVVGTEIVVYDIARGFAGKLDFLAMDAEGRQVILDWKTSSDIFWTHEIQVVAYVAGHQKVSGRTAEWAAIVRFGKTDAEPEFHRIEREKWGVLFNRFCHLIPVFDAFKEAEAARRRLLDQRRKAAEAAQEREQVSA